MGERRVGSRADGRHVVRGDSAGTVRAGSCGGTVRAGEGDGGPAAGDSRSGWSSRLARFAPSPVTHW
ncbi:hypothetical protein GCM10023238_37940 [Streptomyces heliomycini]